MKLFKEELPLYIQQEKWGQIPLLHIYNETMSETTSTVFFLHGHLSAKEHNLHYAYHLVNQGVRVIMPDAIYHGERAENLSELDLSLKFWDIVMKSIEEVQFLYEEGKRKGYITTGKVGIAGSSMGGIVTSACLTQYDWIDTAAICMGVTSLSKLANYQFGTIKINGSSLPMTEQQKNEAIMYLQQFDLENKKEIFNKKPIVFWHGAQDQIIPIHLSYNYYEEQLTDTMAEFIREEKSEHKVSRQGLLKVTAFLAQHLS
jgi:uncharacterized protein